MNWLNALAYLVFNLNLLHHNVSIFKRIKKNNCLRKVPEFPEPDSLPNVCKMSWSNYCTWPKQMFSNYIDTPIRYLHQHKRVAQCCSNQYHRLA